MATNKTARTAVISSGAAMAGSFCLEAFPAGQPGPIVHNSANFRQRTNQYTKEGTHDTHSAHRLQRSRLKRRIPALFPVSLVEALKAAYPDVTVTYRDLGHQEIPYVTEEFIGAMYTPAEQRTA